MQAKLTYAIKFVADMDRAIAFYCDTFGLTVRFATPFWSEFDPGEVTRALHPASPETPAGKTQLGFSTPAPPEVYAARSAAGLTFTQPPMDEHGAMLSRLLDCEGAEVSLSQARG